MLRRIFLLSYLCMQLSNAAEVDATSKLKEVLIHEKQIPGLFMKCISQDLKSCTNGKMAELEFLPIKSSYWWDRNPNDTYSYRAEDFSKMKPLQIDNFFRSSVYDRDRPFYIQNSDCEHLGVYILEQHDFETSKFINSYKSVAEKLSFFCKRDLDSEVSEQKKLPKLLDGIVDYGAYMVARLDTYPSIYQMTEALTILAQKHQESTELHRTPLNENKSSSHIIQNVLTQIFETDAYKKLLHQNHPLARIIEDHLNKLMYKAQQLNFNTEDAAAYDRATMYTKILHHMKEIINLLGIFDIDLHKEICTLPDMILSELPDKAKDPYYLYTQLYEVFNDLLFMLIYLDNPYTINDYNRILTQTLVNRFSLIAEFKNNDDMLLASYPMRSCMDGFVNSCMAMGHAPQDISLADKVEGLQNTIYYEISQLLQLYPHRGPQHFFVSLTKELSPQEKKQVEDRILESYAQMYGNNAVSLEVRDWMADDFEKYIQELMLMLSTGGKLPRYKHYQPDRYDLSEIETSKIEDEIKTKIKALILPKLQELKIEGNFFQTITTSHATYMEIPIFIKNEFYNIVTGGLHPSFSEAFLGFMDTHFCIDEHPSLTTGITTDSVDCSGDPTYIDNLHHKMKQIIDVKQALKPTTDPFVMLWDTTLEIDQGPSYALMNNFKQEIEAGKIVFILFKSLQKYASLGIGKSKAGAVTLIGKKTPFVEQIHTKLTNDGQDVFSRPQEYALMTFFHDQFNKETNEVLFRDNEKLYFQATKHHAQQILNKLNETETAHPFSLSGGCVFQRGGNDLYSKIPFADTFGFAIPTQATIGGGLRRYSVGLNPQGLQ